MNPSRLEHNERARNESESNKFVFCLLPEISKFMALEVPEDYNYSLGLQEGVMDLFDFI